MKRQLSIFRILSSILIYIILLLFSKNLWANSIVFELPQSNISILIACPPPPTISTSSQFIYCSTFEMSPPGVLSASIVSVEPPFTARMGSHILYSKQLIDINNNPLCKLYQCSQGSYSCTFRSVPGYDVNLQPVIEPWLLCYK